MLASDAADRTAAGIAGGAYRKVNRWAFERQGVFQAPGSPTPVAREGVAPAQDVYIDDGRHGEYQYQPVHWENQSVWNRRYADAGTQHEEPWLNRTNYAYTRVRNRGRAARHAAPGARARRTPPRGVLQQGRRAARVPPLPVDRVGEVRVKSISVEVDLDCRGSTSHANAVTADEPVVVRPDRASPPRATSCGLVAIAADSQDAARDHDLHAGRPGRRRQPIHRLAQRLRFSRGRTCSWIGVPTNPNSSRSRRSMKRS